MWITSKELIGRTPCEWERDSLPATEQQSECYSHGVRPVNFSESTRPRLIPPRFGLNFFLLGPCLTRSAILQ